MALNARNNKIITALINYEVNRAITLGIGLTDSINELVYYQHLVFISDKLEGTLVDAYKLGAKLQLISLKKKIADLQKEFDDLSLEDKRSRIMEIAELQAQLEVTLDNGS